MAGYLRELKELLLKAGCEYVRPGKGDHEIWYSRFLTATSRSTMV